MNAPPAAPPTAAAETKPKFRAWEIALLVAPFVLVWGVYLALRTSMPDDPLAPFRNGLYWPGGEELLLAKGGGIVSRVLLHLGFTFALGIALLIGFVVVRGVVSKRESQSNIGTFVCFALAFVLMLGVSTVPNRITRVDDGEIVVSHMIPVSPYPVSTEEMEVDEVRALGARLGVRGTKSKERVVRLFALREKGEPLELGEAECPGSDEKCLAWADPAVALFAKRLGWKGKPRVSTEDDGALRKYEPATP